MIRDYPRKLNSCTHGASHVTSSHHDIKRVSGNMCGLFDDLRQAETVHDNVELLCIDIVGVIEMYVDISRYNDVTVEDN
jgi:hypothetical protein